MTIFVASKAFNANETTQVPKTDKTKYKKNSPNTNLVPGPGVQVSVLLGRILADLVALGPHHPVPGQLVVATATVVSGGVTRAANVAATPAATAVSPATAGSGLVAREVELHVHSTVKFARDPVVNGVPTPGAVPVVVIVTVRIRVAMGLVLLVHFVSGTFY